MNHLLGYFITGVMLGGIAYSFRIVITENRTAGTPYEQPVHVFVHPSIDGRIDLPLPPAGPPRLESTDRLPWQTAIDFMYEPVVCQVCGVTLVRRMIAWHHMEQEEN